MYRRGEARQLRVVANTLATVRTVCRRSSGRCAFRLTHTASEAITAGNRRAEGDLQRVLQLTTKVHSDSVKKAVGCCGSQSGSLHVFSDIGSRSNLGCIIFFWGGVRERGSIDKRRDGINGADRSQGPPKLSRAPNTLPVELGSQ